MTSLVPGTPVVWKDRNWILLDILGYDRAVIRDPKSGQTQVATPVELRADPVIAAPGRAVASIPEEEWNRAWKRFEAIRPLLDKPKRERSAKDVDRVAKSLGKDRATIYRWIAKWEETQTVTALTRNGRSDRGKARLSAEVETILLQQIETYYLTPERPTPVELWERVCIACRKCNLPTPNLSTIRRRIARLQDRTVVAKRLSAKQAREQYEPHRGTFPGADVPRSVYQIDHSPIDVIFVDEKFRQPIGRGNLTMVQDCCTRMLAGFCISLDPPGALSVGLAMAHAILPKEVWLGERSIDAIWPLYGFPAKIYADNAKEFRGTMLERACDEYGIIIENRPKGMAHFGGHIERMVKTAMKRAQRIPGTTFSNVQERGEYDSEGRAIMTIAEFEQWFGYFVTHVYHQSEHSGIGDIPPIKLYDQFVLGTNNRKGIGLPVPPANEYKLRLDFMPYLYRTIQEYGVLIDNIHYYADVLRPWIHARDRENAKLKRKFVFARDPRDISQVYFLDPETGIYHTVPYRDLTHPRMSLWELNAVLKRIEGRPELQPDEATIFAGLEEMHRIQEQSAQRSKKARRNLQRKENWRKAALLSPREPLPVNSETAWEPASVRPFDDIEEAQ